MLCFPNWRTVLQEPRSDCKRADKLPKIIDVRSMDRGWCIPFCLTGFGGWTLRIDSWQQPYCISFRRPHSQLATQTVLPRSVGAGGCKSPVAYHGLLFFGPPVHLSTYLPADIHAYIHTYIHTFIHTCIHAYIHTYIQMVDTYTHAYIHTHTHSSRHTVYIHACMHTCVCMYACMHAYKYGVVYVCMYVCMYACMYVGRQVGR